MSFSTVPFEQDAELTGPLAATLYISSTAADADLFLTVRAFAPDGTEHLVLGSVEPHAPITQGWLRASHRKLDSVASKPYQPVHTHDEIQPLEPGKVYEDRVIAHCKAHMAPFKVPKRVVFVDSLPKNPSGKLLKRELRRQFEAPPAV